MHFHIRFPNGEKVPIGTLNAEAANLWGIGIERDKYKYVFPKERGINPQGYNEENSWYAIIGNGITHPKLCTPEPMQQTWDNVKETLFNEQTNMGEIWDEKFGVLKAEILSALDYLEPYFELIDLWYSKGYIPVRVK